MFKEKSRRRCDGSLLGLLRTCEGQTITGIVDDKEKICTANLYNGTDELLSEICSKNVKRGLCVWPMFKV